MQTSKSNDCPHRAECPDPQDTMVVYGGPIDAEVVIVGQSPGETEEATGSPFVGPAGQELRKTLQAVGWDDSKILFTNACMCKPTDNATPTYKQVKLCRGNLFTVLRAYPRKLVIALGNEAWSALHNEPPGGVTKRCGVFKRIEELDNTPSMSTYHPSFVLRDPKHSTQLYRDLEAALMFYQNDGKAQSPDINWKLFHPYDEGVPPQYYLMQIEQSPWLVVDVETTGTSEYDDRLLGVGLGFVSPLGTEQYLYVSLLHGEGPSCPWTAEEWVGVYRWLKAALTRREGQELLAHNVKFEARMLWRQLGIDLRPLQRDTMIDVFLVDPTRSAGLKDAATFYLKAPRWDEEWQDDKGRTVAHYISAPSKHLGMVPREVVAKYCCLDCYYSVKIGNYSRTRFTIRQQQFYEAVLGPLLQNTLNIELEGIPIDCNGLRDLEARLAEEEDAILKRIAEVAGPELNIGSAMQLREYLYDRHRLDRLFSYVTREDGSVVYFDEIEWETKAPVKSRKFGVYKDDLPADVKEWAVDVVDMYPQFVTSAGALSTAQNVCEFIGNELSSGRHPAFAGSKANAFIQEVLRYRTITKLNATYVRSWLEYSQWDGRLHPSFLLHGTETGRMASADPNLQNVPEEICQYVIAPPGWLVCESDFAQLELRVWADYSKCPNLLKVLTSEDFHRYAMGQALGKPADQVTKEERDAGKVIVFGGLMYGGGVNIVSKQSGLSYAEASEKLQQYRSAFPTGTHWLDSQVAFARENLYVESATGRRRPLPGILSNDKGRVTMAERQAMNTVIQGTAADITFIALNRVMKELTRRKMQSKVINTVHDSIILLCPEHEKEAVYDLLKEQMTRTPYYGFTVPLDVEIEFHKRWKSDEVNLSFLERTVT